MQAENQSDHSEPVDKQWIGGRKISYRDTKQRHATQHFGRCRKQVTVPRARTILLASKKLAGIHSDPCEQITERHHSANVAQVPYSSAPGEPFAPKEKCSSHQ